MRIGIDARVLHFPGIGRYLRNLIAGLAEVETDDRFTLYISRPEHREALPALLGDRFRVRVLPHTFSLREQWQVPRAAAADRLDLFHTPHYVVPLFLGCPCVATLHDLTYYRHPRSLRSPAAQAYYRLMHRVGHYRVERIICNSNATARDLRRVLRVPEGKLETIHMGIDRAFRPAGPEAVAALRARLQASSFLLYVGTKKPFKNVPTLLRAFRRLLPADPDLHLVLAGRGEIEDPEISQLLADADLARRVRMLPPLPDAELAVLYSAARALVLPSRNEGFGFSLVEAMACGTPCVAADAGSLPEVAGGAALLFPPEDPAALAAALRQVLEDPALAADLAARGRERARNFDWGTVAARTYAVYRATLRGEFRGRREEERERRGMNSSTSSESAGSS